MSKTSSPGVAAWSALLRAHAALVPRIAGEVESATGLPLSWYDVLLELNAADGRRLHMQELGNRVVLSRSQVSRIVDRVEAAGLVVREPDPDDRRATFAAITAKGRETLRRVAPVYLASIQRHFTSHMSDAQLRGVHRALEHLLRRHQGRAGD